MKIIVFGLGAIGSNILVQLAKRYGNVTFTGVDYDVVEERNIGPQAFFMEHIGQPKSAVMPVILGRYMRQFHYASINKKIESVADIDTIRKSSSDQALLIDCFDNTESRQLLKDYGEKEKDTDMLHIGFSPQYTAEIMWNKGYDVPGRVDPDHADICENPDASAFISFIVNFAALVAMEFLDNGVKNNYIITQKFKIKAVS